MFTKLIRLVMTILLMSAIVVGLAQQVNIKPGQTRIISSSQQLPEGTKPVEFENPGDVVLDELYYMNLTAQYYWDCPDQYGDEEFGVRFTSVSNNALLTEAALLFYNQLGTPDINVNVYDVPVAGGFPGTLLGSVVVPNAQIQLGGSNFTYVDLSSLNLTFNAGEEFYITYSVVGGIYNSVEMNILSDGGGQGVNRSVEYYGSWGTMLNDWGLDVEFFIVAYLNVENDDCANAYACGEVTNLIYSTTGETFDGPGLCQTAPNVWFDYTATKGGDLTIHTNGSLYNTKIALYDGFDCGTMTEVACDDDGGTAGASLITVVGINAGDQFKIEVGGFGTEVGDGYLTISVIGCENPTAQTVSNITLTSADLGWTSIDSFFDVYYGENGVVTPPTPATLPTVENNPGLSYSLTGPASTVYQFWVRADCDPGNNNTFVSDWVGPKTFGFLCGTCTGIPEGEPQLPNGGTLAGINGGCAVGQPFLTSPIAFGDTYCGQSNTFIDGTGASARDNDYYYLDLTTPSDQYWTITATLKGNSLVNLTLFNAGNMTCAIGAVAAVTSTSPCELVTINALVPSGNYYVVARVATAAGNQWPVGTGPWQYELTLNGTGPLGAPDLSPIPPTSITKTFPPTGGSTTENITIGNAGTYPLDYSLNTTGAYNPVWQDKFDTYAAGVQIVQQNPIDWTTWNLPTQNPPGGPGSAMDPFVSNAQAYSSPNSVKVDGTVIDLVHTFPNYITGSYKISHRMYVVSGNVGYFNTLLTFDQTNALYEWGMQVAFDIGGTATLDAEGVAYTFPFTYDTWMLNEVYVDLDNDYAEYWCNGTFIADWTWSAGTGGYSTNQLAGNDFFAYTGPNNTDPCLYYIDDYTVEVAGNDWLSINGGLGVSGTIDDGAPPVIVTLGIDAGTKPVGTYTKTINFSTNEIGQNSYPITVTMYVGYAITGNVYYGSAGTSKPMATNTTITCTPGPVGSPATVNTGDAGAYVIRPFDNGNYLLTGATTYPGNNLQITTSDAIIVSRMAASLGTPYTTIQYRAGDVNLSNSVTTSDVILIKRRAANFPGTWAAPAYVFDGPFGIPNPVLGGMPVVVSNSNATQVIRALLSGDLNSSHTP